LPIVTVSTVGKPTCTVMFERSFDMVNWETISMLNASVGQQIKIVDAVAGPKAFWRFRPLVQYSPLVSP
jgi:hypothetical protein